MKRDNGEARNSSRPRRPWTNSTASAPAPANFRRRYPITAALLAAATVLTLPACAYFRPQSEPPRPIDCDSVHLRLCDRAAPVLTDGSRASILRAAEQLRAQRDECAIRHAGLVKCVKDFNAKTENDK